MTRVYVVTHIAGLFPDISFCDAEIGGFGQDVFYQNIEVGVPWTTTEWRVLQVTA